MTTAIRPPMDNVKRIVRASRTNRKKAVIVRTTKTSLSELRISMAEPVFKFFNLLASGHEGRLLGCTYTKEP